MSVLDKQNKEQFGNMSDMFKVSVKNLPTKSHFPLDKHKSIHNLESEIERIFSKNILSTISKINKHYCYCFIENEEMEIYFSICEYYTCVYNDSTLGQLQLPIKVTFIFKDGENMHTEIRYYGLTIHILTDEAREFVIKSIQNLKK